MDMQVDSKRIRMERERRAWSQEQLAEVAGLSLRTVQRVESSGSASYESARAIGAVLELEVTVLRAAPAEKLPVLAATAVRVQPGGLRYFGLAALLVLALGIFFTRDAVAGEVMLEVGLELNDQKLGQHRMVANEGKSAEIRLEGQVRLFVNPIVTKDGSILLSMRVEEPAGTRWVEVGEPKIMVANGNRGEVKVTSDKGNVYRIAIRPSRM